jgi:Flp pilus assembly protein TadB
MACIHGNDPRTCIVCKTLAEVDSMTGKETGGRRATTTRSASRRATETAPVDLVSRSDRTPSTGGGHRFGFHVAVFAAVLIAAAISVWFVAGIVFAFIRLIEIVLVAIVAGTLGYRVGRARGRREQQ